MPMMYDHIMIIRVAILAQDVLAEAERLASYLTHAMPHVIAAEQELY